MELRLGHIQSVTELRARAGEWDDLWQRSASVVPRARAELIALFVEHFAKPAQFHAWTVEDDGRLVAALPLIRTGWGLASVETLPRNEWIHCGELLVDPAVDTRAVLEVLATIVALGRSPLLRLEQVRYEQAPWPEFLGIVQRRKGLVQIQPHYTVGEIDLTTGWEACENRLSGNFRRSLKKNGRKLDEAGDSELLKISQFENRLHEVAPLIQAGFEVEDRSWKGAEGTSVLKNPHILAYFRREAAQLAVWGQLELAFLEHRGQPIAFDYGFRSKGVHLMPKIGYDEAFRAYGPGQLLMQGLLQALHTDPDCRLLDFQGPLVPWNENWATRTYQVGKLLIAAHQGLSRFAFEAETVWRPQVSAWKQRLLGLLQREPEAETTAAGAETSAGSRH